MKIKAVYEGDLRTILKHIPSGETIKTDAPIDNLGKGEYFSPTDLLCSSLASCMLTIMAIAARKHGISIKGTDIDITKKMSSSPRMVSKIKVNINFKKNFSNKKRLILERTALACPVHRSLSVEIDIDVNFNYNKLNNK
tara:strand:+ start:101 stop:517 length:417 start_codon:yes stop_codon:yes gene_type:complete